MPQVWSSGSQGIRPKSMKTITRKQIIPVKGSHYFPHRRRPIAGPIPLPTNSFPPTHPFVDTAFRGHPPSVKGGGGSVTERKVATRGQPSSVRRRRRRRKPPRGIPVRVARSGGQVARQTHTGPRLDGDGNACRRRGAPHRARPRASDGSRPRRTSGYRLISDFGPCPDAID